MRDQMNKKNRAKKLQKEAQNRKAADASEKRALKQAQGLQAAGLPMEKQWSSVGDKSLGDNKPAACSICLANDNAGWIPIDDAFPSGHMHPPAHDGCRCAILTRWAREDRDEPKSKLKQGGLLSRLLGKK